jgi:hypothetical protein
MRVAEHATAQQLEMLEQLELRVEPSAGVVEIDLIGAVEAGEVGRAELVQDARARVARVRAVKRSLRRGRSLSGDRWV